MSKNAGVTLNQLRFRLPKDLDVAVHRALKDWAAGGKVRKLWNRDTTLWTGRDEDQWLGWLDIVEQQLAGADRFTALAAEIKQEGWSHALLLGMGGSSLCPEVLSLTFGKAEGFPELLVLDSTDPAQIRFIESKVDLSRTLCIVSSKSGSTLEPNIFKQYFFDRVRQVVGASEAGRRFVAITDPKSHLQQEAEREKFRRVFFGLPSIGGRYSALSDFGIVPAAVMGMDVPRFLRRTAEMVGACGEAVAAPDNPGVVLGAILGVLATHGRDKVTIVASPGIYDLGAWLEQLLAESTGKQGHALIPVDREATSQESVYGDDRLFVYLRLQTGPDPVQDEGIALLEQAGHPVVRIELPEVYTLGQEFFRWEIATAVAGSIMGIHPFDQPDVEASKVETKKLTAQVEQTGALPPESPILDDRGIKLFTDAANASALHQSAGADRTVAGYLRAHLNRLVPDDYAALLAYIEMSEPHEEQLQAIRHMIRDKKRVATCLGFGPRFLHSTGQAYKGGPNTGVMLQVTCDDADDLAVPERRYSFGTVKAAQARGDFQVLVDRGRRALRVHLGADVQAGLATLRTAVLEALS